jgi:hypothetical protein
MSNCHVRELSRVYSALFQDAKQAYPTLEAEFERDLARLKILVPQRGIAVYLLDLPAAGKHFDKCLAAGEYKLSGLPLTKRFSGRTVIPKFLRGLYLLVFYEDGRLREDYDVQAIFFIRQIYFVAKKASVACSDDKIEREILDFVDVDKELPEVDDFWLPDSSTSCSAEIYHGFSKSTLYTERVESSPACKRGRLSAFLARLDLVSGLVTSTLGSYDPNDWKFRHGPGAISEVTGPSNKYCWTNWSDSLEREFPIANYGYHSYSSWARDIHRLEGLGSEEPYSRLVAVPKSYSKPRLIAAVPSSHQWCQQNLWHYMRERSTGSWIIEFVRFNDQTLNQDLCRLGASHGGLSTVDLSAASDRVTCHAVGQLFRSNAKLLRCLKACRTRRIRQTLTRNAPEFIELRKFSTMGSACTFPVESLMFLSIAIASVLTVRKQPVNKDTIWALRGSVAVFGDDIIVPSDSRELLFDALEVLHFKVNVQKSFWTGKFRESCGVDAFAGVDVTPVYWKAPNDGKPGSLDSTVEVSNNFYKKWLLNTSAVVSSTLPWDIPKVGMRSGAFGLKSRTRLLDNNLPSRWNEKLQRAEVKLVAKITRQHRLPTGDESALLQYFTEEPSPYDIWTSGVPQRPLLKIQRRWVAIADLETQLDEQR